MRKMQLISGTGAVMALFALACDGGSAGESQGEGTGDVPTYAGFALTGDDESDDGFDEDADTRPLYQATDPAAWNEDGSERPAPDEARAMPPGFVAAKSVLLVWGQPQYNPELAETPTAWTGRVRTDSGVLRVARVIRFERGLRELEDGTVAGQGDKLVRDEDPATVGIDTLTTTHNDGVLLLLGLPEGDADGADPADRAIEGDLVFETEHFTKSIPLATILEGGVQTFIADDLGNSLLVASGPAHRCAHGLVRMAWERKDERGGVFAGKVYGADGELTGRLVGIWGVVDGKRRMKGLFEGPEGEARGRVIGTWQPFPETAGEDGGTFRAVWQGIDGKDGVIGGVYRVGDEGGQGTAAGFWRAACGDRDAQCRLADEPVAASDASCACEPDPENDFDGACNCDVPPPPSSCVPPEE